MCCRLWFTPPNMCVFAVDSIHVTNLSILELYSNVSVFEKWKWDRQSRLNSSFFELWWPMCTSVTFPYNCTGASAIYSRWPESHMFSGSFGVSPTRSSNSFQEFKWCLLVDPESEWCECERNVPYTFDGLYTSPISKTPLLRRMMRIFPWSHGASSAQTQVIVLAMELPRLHLCGAPSSWQSSTSFWASPTIYIDWDFKKIHGHRCNYAQTKPVCCSSRNSAWSLKQI